MDKSYSDNSEFRTSMTLIDALQRRDESAWKRFVRIYQPLVLFWVRWRGKVDQEEAQNQILQEVWVAVFQGLHRYRPRPKKRFRGWLWRVTWTRIVNHYKSHHNQSKGGDTAFALVYDLAAYEEEADDDDATENRALLDRIMATLSPKERFVLEAKIVRGLEYTEIAREWEELGNGPTKVGTFRQILRRATEKVRALLDPNV